MIVRKGLIACINFYRLFISPLKPSSCRYHPTCSAYAIKAIEKYGPVSGTVKAIRRIVRCNPYHPGGFDPIL